MSDPYLDRIREYVAQRSRLAFSGHKKGILRQRLEGRLSQLDLPDFSTYWAYLLRTPAEEGKLLDMLTTNETFFFRNSEQFRHLREKILPTLERERGMLAVRSWGDNRVIPPASLMKLRVLCAGCSSGEEPYSVAMTLLESLCYPKAWDMEVLAGDLSESCLKAAAAGYYDEDRLKGLPAAYIERYMERTANGAVIKDEVKQIVRFISLNLNSVMNGEPVPGVAPAFAGFDIIFCRNVMIYFSPACQQLLVDTLHRLLVPGGFLFTGDAEPLHLFDHDFVAVKSAGCLIYRKKTEITHNAEAI